MHGAYEPGRGWIAGLAVLLSVAMIQGAPAQSWAQASPDTRIGASGEQAPARRVTYAARGARKGDAKAGIGNPERGFYRHVETRASTKVPYDLAALQRYRAEQGVTLLLCIYYLDIFVDRPMDAAFLDLLARNLATVREAGQKCILRFAYTDAASGGAPPFGDATKDIILAHIDQLAPFLRDNDDVIAVMQAGFIGVWGEWYYTDHFVDDPTRPDLVSSARWADRHEVLARLLDVLPVSRMAAVRTPQAKQSMFGTTTPITADEAHSGSDLARTAAHNDCFLASDTDSGTYLDPDDRPYLAAESPYLSVGGETCQPNPPRSDCATALAELDELHWSYLNVAYHPEIIARWQQEGCYDQIAQRLGYRLFLIDGAYDKAVQPGHQLAFTLRLENRGWAAPFNPRPVELVLRDERTGARYTAELPDDPRFWIPGNGTVHTLAHTVCTPADMPEGQYELLLRLPDPAPSLRQRPEYAMLLANADVPEPETGLNRLQHRIRIKHQAAASPCTSALRFAPTAGGADGSGRR